MSQSCMHFRRACVTMMSLNKFLWIQVSLEHSRVKSQSSAVPTHLLQKALTGSSGDWVMH